ncbi:unnamed protein product [Nippostrongylus brasiliensis]|uniref:Hyphally regulated cell wall protein 1 n=1 Tax=Nippostrongylus brasiliensis TaxID=27835 RepID=A0A0N4YGH0_NIPBR|nr:unnamed protein product [Nippostrongylus brasiliensis]
MQFIALLLVAGVAFAQYDTQPSGYGNNNPKHVQYVAGKSPKNKPVDYTKSNDAPGGSNVWGNWFNQQNLGQANNQGQQSVQKGGDQTNVGANSNAVNVGQSNNQGRTGYGSGNGYKPAYDAPTYGAANPAPYNPFNFVGNNVFAQNLGQANAQGQQNYQQGGAQTNLGANSNQVNAGQSNNQGAGPYYGGNSGYKPSYDAPSYGGNAGASYGAVLIPINPAYGGGPGSFIGGAQTNAGMNANAVNVGQDNNQGGSGPYKGYDAPRYGPAPPSYKPSPPAPAPYKPAPAPYKPAPPAYKPSPPAPPAYKPAPAPYKPAPAPYKPAPAPYKPEPKHEETGGYRLH